ncbi:MULTISPECIES: substrate-binding domain-containing protein [unclassified Chelatococcus]|uniref:substrate-binding domain-containing protein n=1 Tax=unclassified Chelatococcus TaxID=2638111 RepID=UPI001BD0E549|nr:MULTISPECIES: substrate-binding domain-containing protein [unclassified Chelatococcus]MBS7701158.1 substrate-binding domain-containing protein [Chelatococcus sp. YT9]MBX3557289.1 substrate-binding domain-containing protein [Chelatococcus sp.]
MTSLRKLASHLGLSITTVSRALDGYSDVAAATRERVERAAKEMGYRPNPAARRLRRGVGETVAFVLPTDPGHFHEPVFSELLVTVGEELARHEHDLMLLAARPGKDEMAVYRRLVEGRRADAFILVRTRHQDERVAYLTERGVPFVCHGRTDTTEAYAFIDGDGEEGFNSLTKRLITRGHRRIAFLSAPAHLTFAGLRLAGWRGAIQAAGLSADMSEEAEPTEEGGFALAHRFFERDDRPTALVCSTDRMAIGAIRAAADRGLAVGSDIAITGHDNIPAASYCQPSLTTMELPTRLIGARLAHMVLARLGGTDVRDLTEIHRLVQMPRSSSGEGGD